MIEIDVNAINIPTHTCLQDCLKNNKHTGAVNIAVTFMCCNLFCGFKFTAYLIIGLNKKFADELVHGSNPNAKLPEVLGVDL